MANLKELVAQRNNLDAEIAISRNAERIIAITNVKNIVEEFGLTEKQIFSKRKPYKKAQAKYRDPASGAMWSGRGREPLWIKGKNREDFAITVEA